MDDRQPTNRNVNDASELSARGARAMGDDVGEGLLSAYLDGECTAAEQAQIEERIAGNLELRQLVDELRGVRANLELLPQYRLEPDFAERVLRRAEREVLVGGGKWTEDREPNKAVVAPVAPPVPISLPTDQGQPGRARPFLWTLVALAAAVLILVTNREPEIRRDPLAQGSPAARSMRAKKSPTTVDKKAAKPAASALQSASDDMLPQGEARTEGDKAGEVQRPGSPTPPATYDRREDGGREESVSDSKAQREAEQPGLGAILKKDSVANDAVEDTGPTDARAIESIDRADPDLKRSRSRSDEQRVEVERAPSAQSPTEKRELDEGRLRLRAPEAPTADEEIRPTESVPALTAGAAPAADRGAKEAAAGVQPGLPLQDQEYQPSGAVVANDDAAASFATPQESLRVVEVFVERDAWQRGAVDEILAKNQIVLYDSKSPAITPEGAPAAAAPAEPRENNQEAKQAVNKPDPAATSDGMELFVVSATSAQVEAALGDFGKQDSFQVVNVTDASAPAQLLGMSLQNQSNRLSKTAVRGGQLPSPTSEVLRDRSVVLDADNQRDAARSDEPPGQPTGQSAAKKLPQAIPPVDNKAGDSLFMEEGVAGEPEKSRELVEAPTRARRARTAPSLPTESREDIRAGAGGVAGRGLALPDAVNKSSAGGFGGYGYGGGRGGEESAGRSRYAVGGVGGGGYGSAIPADPGTTNVPRGYAQRVTIQPSVEYYRKQDASTFEFGASSQGIRLQNEAPRAGGLTPEQVLFLFRVVDAPLFKAKLERGQSATESSRPARRTEPDAAERGGRASTPAPAPAPGSAR